jgi:hypothetical protein
MSETDNKAFAQLTTLYQAFLEERAEILRHKWLWSEREGRDVGFDAALIDWVRHHRAAWHKARRTETVRVH